MAEPTDRGPPPTPLQRCVDSWRKKMEADLAEQQQLPDEGGALVEAAGKLAGRTGRRAEWDGAVFPGQRIGLDLDKAEGFLEEPLHNAEHAALKERIARKGMALGEAREVFKRKDRLMEKMLTVLLAQLPE